MDAAKLIGLLTEAECETSKEGCPHHYGRVPTFNYCWPCRTRALDKVKLNKGRIEITEGSLVTAVRIIGRRLAEYETGWAYIREAARRLVSNVVTCVYCGHEYPEGTPAAKDALLTEHIARCEKHPMRELSVIVSLLEQTIEMNGWDAFWVRLKGLPVSKFIGPLKSVLADRLGERRNKAEDTLNALANDAPPLSEGT